MRKTFISMLIVTIIWGSTFPLQKLVLSNTSPFVYNSIRFAIASILSFHVWKIGSFKYGVILGLVLSAGYVTQTLGLTITTASKSGFITSLYVVLVPLVSYFLEKRKVNIFQLIGFSLAFIGLYLLSNGINDFNFGDFLNLLCAISFAFHVVLITIFSKMVNHTDLLTVQFVVVSIVNTILGFRSNWKIDLRAFSVITYTALFATVYGIYVQTKYQKKIGSNLSALIFSGEPVFSAIFSFLILGEVLSIKQIFGAIILLIAITMSSIQMKKSSKSDRIINE